MSIFPKKKENKKVENERIKVKKKKIKSVHTYTLILFNFFVCFVCLQIRISCRLKKKRKEEKFVVGKRMVFSCLLYI